MFDFSSVLLHFYEKKGVMMKTVDGERQQAFLVGNG